MHLKFRMRNVLITLQCLLLLNETEFNYPAPPPVVLTGGGYCYICTIYQSQNVRLFRVNRALYYPTNCGMIKI